MKAIFKSIASYIPENILTNDDLAKIVDTNDEWISKRTGIKERRVANSDEKTSDLAYKAALKAIERAGIDASDIDLILLATITPDYFCMPSTACLVAAKLGIKNIPAFDISAACSGFVYGLSVAKAYVESGMAKNVLLIGAETITRVMDYNDRSTCIIFGDGAGACIISAGEGKGVLDVSLGADGEFSDFIQTPLNSTNSHQNILNSAGDVAFMQMKGNETFKVAVKTLSSDVIKILERNSITANDIDFYIPHQANLRIISAVGDAIKLPEGKLVLTLENYGNTSAASIPMAIAKTYDDGKLKDGSLVLINAFGGGLTWGSSLFYFNS